MKQFRLLLLIITAALFSAAAWADAIDPKVIITSGTGSTAITLTDPNPIVTANAVANTGQCLFEGSAACVQAVFQNQTGVTIHTLTIAITDIAGLVFTCGDSSSLLFFNSCTSSDVGGVTDISFFNSADSAFHGVDSATQQCVADSDKLLAAIDKILFSLPGGCQKWDPDDYKFVGGEFSLDIEGADLAAGTAITAQAITTPEPGSGLMVLFGALAFGLFKLVRRAV